MKEQNKLPAQHVTDAKTYTSLTCYKSSRSPKLVGNFFNAIPRRFNTLNLVRHFIDLGNSNNPQQSFRDISSKRDNLENEFGKANQSSTLS